MGLSALAAATLLAAMAPGTAPDCQAALQGAFDDFSDAPLPGQLDGAGIGGPEALLALRLERGDAPIIIAGGNFAGADFRDARLHNVCFLGTNLTNTDWRGAQAPGIAFARSDLTGAQLAGASMRRILLREPTMPNVDASGADFSNGLLNGGWEGSLANVRLDGANLKGFRFECGITIDDGCPLDREISFRGADLSGAHVDTYWGSGGFEDARIDRTTVALTQLEGLGEADIIGPVIVRGDEATAELSRAELEALLPHLALAGEASTPSFDCARASSPPERAICGDEGGQLRALDRDLAALFRRASAADPSLAASQQSWLRGRDSCRTEEGELDTWCMEEAYKHRRAELVAVLGPPAWARPGTYALFVSPAVEFDDAFRETALYRRLVPVITGSASSHVVVRVNPDGSIDARGDAIGGNAHTCSLGGDNLRFDPATGWYSGPQEAHAQDPPDWRGRPMRVLLFWDDRGALFQSGHPRWGGEDGGDPRVSDYASCGARAGFGEMIRVTLPQDELRRRFDAYGEVE